MSTYTTIYKILIEHGETDGSACEVRDVTNGLNCWFSSFFFCSIYKSKLMEEKKPNPLSEKVRERLPCLIFHDFSSVVLIC